MAGLAEKKSILLAIDFDDTFTADPALWSAVIRLAKDGGHRVFCVSCRRETFENRAEMREALPEGVPIFLTSFAPKEYFMGSRGHKVDVWIDDYPLSISEGR